ncbi:MAG: cupin domain-containing protein [Candidatus Methanomethylicia archaeon]
MSIRIIDVNTVKIEKRLGGPIKRVFAGISNKLLFSIGVFNPGEGLNPHIHPESDEVYYVLEGEGTVHIGSEGKEYPVNAGLALYIPAGTIHSVTNTSNKMLKIAFFVAPGTEPPIEVK